MTCSSKGRWLRVPLAVLMAACGSERTTAPPIGTIEVSVVTVGVDPDPDGYSVSLDGNHHVDLPGDGSVTLDGIELGSHVVSLGGLASNCSAVETADVRLHGLSRDAEVAFEVSCQAAIRGRILFAAEGEDGQLRLHTILPDGSDMQRVSDFVLNPIAPLAHLSPDGTRIALTGTGDSGRATIFTMNADGSDVVRLTDLYFSRDPRWSPDGERLAFEGATSLAEWSDGSTDIYVVDADGSNLVNLSAHPTRDFQPAWSPDGEVIAFVSDRHEPPEDWRSFFTDWAIYLVDADGATEPSALTLGLPLRQYSPTWSPDPLRITFYVHPGTTDTPSGLYIMTRGTDEMARLSGCSEGYAPTWSPDGTQYVVVRVVPRQLCMTNEVEGPSILLTDPSYAAESPSWSQWHP